MINLTIFTAHQTDCRMLLYRFVRPLMTWALKRHYRRIDLAHADRIPRKQAVILAANHPTAFTEPCILACLLDRDLYFLVRGDMFKHPVFGRLLKWLHMLPVYRIQDGGYQNLKQNYDTFAACFKALSEQRTIMILAEGRCIHEKRLRPLKKGTARLALGALEADPQLEEVFIVPIGVNYTHAEQARSEVMIRCGEPIKASDFREAYNRQPNVAINELTDQLAAALREHVIHIDRREDDRLAEDLLTIHRTERPLAGIRRTITREALPLEGEKALINRLNAMPEADRSTLRQLTGEYFGRLRDFQLDDAALAGKYSADRKNTTRLWLGLAPALMLGIWHLLPLALGQWMANTKIRTIEFFSPVRLAAWLAAYLFYALVWVGLGLGTGAWPLALVPIASIALMPWWLNYLDEAYRWQLGWRAGKPEPHDLDYLRQHRREILEKIKA